MLRRSSGHHPRHNEVMMGSSRILILEADRRLRLARAGALSRDGYSVTGVTRTEEAVQAAREERFALLVVGVMPPELLDELQDQLPPGMAVLVIAAEDTIRRVAESAGTAMRSFLLAPVTTRKLKETVARAIDSARRVRDSVRSDVLASLQETGTLPTTKAETDRFFKHIVETSAADAAADYVSLHVRNENTGALVTRAHVGDRRPGCQEVCRKAASTGEPLLLDETAQGHSHLRNLMGRAGISAMLCVPLKIGGEVVGALNHFKVSERARFTTSDLDFAGILGRWSSTALENVRLYDAAQGRYLQVQRLLQEVSAAQENERRRMAVEIHDGVAQWMVGASYGIRACSALVSESRLDDLRRELDETRQTVQRSIKELRRTIANLRPLPLEELGLVAAVRQAAEELAEDGITCRAEVDGSLPKLSTPEETTTYWTIQEILTNVRRHSGASEVTVRMQCRDGMYSVVVNDDGQGFAPGEVRKSERSAMHMGLIGMKERVELLGGHLTIDSDHGKGTTIRFAFPVSAGETVQAMTAARG